MNKSDLQLWNLLLPMSYNDGDAITNLDDKLIGDFIIEVAGGYTYPFVNVTGFYQNNDDTLVREGLRTIQIAATLEDISKIACYVKTVLKQESVMFYQVSPHAFFV